VKLVGTAGIEPATARV